MSSYSIAPKPSEFHDPALAPHAFLRGKSARVLFFLFWVVFFALITRLPVFPDLNTPAWALADALGMLLFASDPKPVLAVARRCKLLLLWPILATLSGVWSIEPLTVMYHGIQFGLSFFVAIVFYCYLGLGGALRVIFVYLLTLQLVSLVFMAAHLPGSFDLDGHAQGAFQHKNELGLFSSLQILCSVSLFFEGWRRLTVFAVLLSMALVAASGSGTAILVTASLVPFLPIVWILRRGPGPVGVAFGLGVAGAAAAFLALATFSADPTASVLTALGKDATFSGRSILWDLGGRSFDEHPILGVGFMAFWYSNDADYLRYVIDQYLVAFHNAYVETAVAFGVVGLILFVVTHVQQLARSVAFFTGSASGTTVFPLLFYLWVLIYCNSETLLFINCHIQVIYCVAAAAISGAFVSADVKP